MIVRQQKRKTTSPWKLLKIIDVPKLLPHHRNRLLVNPCDIIPLSLIISILLVGWCSSVAEGIAAKVHNASLSPCQHM